MGSSKFEKLVMQLLRVDDGSVFFSRSFKGVSTETFYAQALASAALERADGCGFRVWGVTRKKRQVVGTTFSPSKPLEGVESFEERLSTTLDGKANVAFLEGDVGKKRIVVMRVESAASGGGARATDKQLPIEELAGAQPSGWLGAATDELNKSYALDLLDWQSLYRSLSLPIPEATADIIAQLNRMRLLAVREDAVTITNLGALATGRDLRMFDALDRLAIQVVIYRGTGRAEAVATRRFDTGYATSIDAACLWINAHFESAPAFEEKRGKPSETNDAPVKTGEATGPYPIAALREVIANAAAHQNVQLLDRAVQSDLMANAFLLSQEYLPGAGPLVEVFSDRIEVSNTGSLNVPLAQIAHEPSRAKGSPLTQILRYYRTRPTPRSGWGTILESCDMHRAPLPVFHTEQEELASLEFAQSADAHAASEVFGNASSSESDRQPATNGKRVRVTLRPIAPFKDLSAEQRLIATYWHAVNCHSHGEHLTNGSLRERFGVEDTNSAQISRLIKDASRRGLIRVVDPDAAPKFKRYTPYWA